MVVHVDSKRNERVCVCIFENPTLQASEPQHNLKQTKHYV